MTTVYLDADRLAARLKADGPALERAIAEGGAISRRFAVTKLSGRTPKDTGNAAAAWDAGPGEVFNHAPHVGILERGARPHPVNAKGRALLLDWVLRVMKPGATLEEAKGIVFAICAKILRDGQKGHYFVRDSLPELLRNLEAEIARRLQRAGDRR